MPRFCVTLTKNSGRLTVFPEQCRTKERGADMKFIHIADVHLGATPDSGKAYSEIRPKELWDTLEQVIDVCEREKTDLIADCGRFISPSASASGAKGSKLYVFQADTYKSRADCRKSRLYPKRFLLPYLSVESKCISVVRREDGIY